MRLLFFLLFAFPNLIYADCVKSYCADGYDGCGCGPESAECCRKRLMGDNGNSTPAPRMDMQIYDMSIKLFERNMQLQQQKQKMQLQMMKKGDEQIGRQKILDGAELDAYHDKKNKEQIDKQDEIKKVKNQLIGLEPGFAPLKIENSQHQLKYMQETEEKYDKKPDKMKLEVIPEKPVTTESLKRDPKLCQTPTSEYPNRCITNACGISSTESLCCPKDFPYLNHCDCMCYESTDFNCNSYSSFQYYKEN